MGVGSPLLALVCQERRRPPPELEIPSPDNPVRWPLNKSAAAIESGLTPEAGSTLRIYNYADYLAPGVIKQFEADYGVTIQLTTFNDADEALTKIASKKLGFDLYFPSYDSLGKLVAAELLRPLNNDYLTNRTNLWRSFDDPWYDLGSQYTIPYTTYSTGHRLARTTWCRRTSPARDNPYDVFWDTQYRGEPRHPRRLAHRRWRWSCCATGSRTSTPTDQTHMDLVRTQLLELRDTMQPRVTISMYTELPAGQYGLAQMWSGDAINPPYYLPERREHRRAAVLVPRGRSRQGRQRPVRVPGAG